MSRDSPKIGIVIIGRNEGSRLVACLASIDTAVHRVVYVDSGSTDGSQDVASSAGAEVIVLDTDLPFTAARARNTGIAALAESDQPDFVQFIDGDCTLDKDWLTKATRFLIGAPKVAVVCGRRREKFPQNSIYNRMCDAEWNTPIGEAKACGGDALIRWDALLEVGGYNPSLIAGEEPEMCLRFRRKGWQIWRLDAEMTLHDAAITKFSQFWKRARRAGFAAAQGADMYGSDAERHGVASTRRAVIWGLFIPVLILVLTFFFGPKMLWLAAIYPAQVLRLSQRGLGSKVDWEQGLLLTLGKFPEARGVVDFHWRKRLGRKTEIIEYK